MCEYDVYCELTKKTIRVKHSALRIPKNTAVGKSIESMRNIYVANDALQEVKGKVRSNDLVWYVFNFYISYPCIVLCEVGSVGLKK